MRVYLAAPWAHKAEAESAHAFMRQCGLQVVSTWTTQDTDTAASLEHAQSDYAELQRANVLVLLNLCKSDGKATEMGYALAKGYRVIVVGGREGNIFYHLPQVEHVPTLEHAIFALGGTVPLERQQ